MNETDELEKLRGDLVTLYYKVRDTYFILEKFMEVEEQRRISVIIAEAREKLDVPIEELGLTVLTSNVLKLNNIFTLGQLISYTERDIFCIENLGRKSMMDIRAMLEVRKLKFRVAA
jgi:DNA-directed RNA polymerase alpha subunit